MQTWDGSTWQPSEISGFNNESSETECRFKCNLNYTWDGVSICEADTRVANCTNKPVDASWNSTSTMIQTWDGSTWQPSNTDGAYNTVESSTECRFKCNVDYYFHYCDNAPPTLLNPIADIQLNEDASDTIIDLSQVFTDGHYHTDHLLLHHHPYPLCSGADAGLPFSCISHSDLGSHVDNSRLSYTLTNDNNVLVNVSEADNLLTLDYLDNQYGIANVTVGAVDSILGGADLEDSFQSVITSVNDAPTLTSISNLDGAIQTIDYTITYDMIVAAANEYDVEGDSISFRIESLNNGTLTKDGIDVIVGSTMLFSGEELVWNYGTDFGVVNAFSIVAHDGNLASSPAAVVYVNVAAMYFYTWTGSGDGSTWTDSANWDVVPASASGTYPGQDQIYAHVTIGSSASVTISSAQNEKIYTLIIQQDASLNLSPDEANDIDGDPDTWDFAFHDIEMYGGIIYPTQSGTKRTLIYANNITIEGGSINATGKGYAVGQGPGVPSSNKCGAGHGGNGGSCKNGPGGVSYGDMNEPITAGSGSSNTSYTVSSGGGALKIVVSETLIINDSVDYGSGSIQSNSPSDSNRSAGSGSGGSIWIDTNILEGNAVNAIQANGADGINKSSGGSGGRVAIYYDTTNTLDSQSISVTGGSKTGSNNSPGDQGTSVIIEY